MVRPAAGPDIPIPAPAADAAVPEVPAGLNGHAEKAAEIFAADLAAGTVPGVRLIRKLMHLGQPKAQLVREYLNGLSASNGKE